MVPLFASLFSSVLATPQVPGTAIAAQQPVSPWVIVGAIAGVGLIGGLIYLAVRK